MEKLAPTIRALTHLVATADLSAGMLAAEMRIEEFLAFTSQLDQKIQNLELLRLQFLPVMFENEDFPEKQLAETIVEYIDSRLRSLKAPTDVA